MKIFTVIKPRLCPINQFNRNLKSSDGTKCHWEGQEGAYTASPL